MDAPEVEQAARVAGRGGRPARSTGSTRCRSATSVYLLITSDHGMVNTSPTQTIRLDIAARRRPSSPTSDCVRRSGSEHPREGRSHRARELRDRINTKLARGNAYLREELPERFHYQQDPRAGDIVVVMDEVVDAERAASAGARIHVDQRRASAAGAYAGSMAGTTRSRRCARMFLLSARGSARGRSSPEVENVDVYPLMTELLGLAPVGRHRRPRPG